MARLGQFRRDTAANWEAANPIIADGEFILIATDPNKPKVYDAQKVGDGSTRYNNLPQRGFECVQELGNGVLVPMSQDAVTRELEVIKGDFFFYHQFAVRTDTGDVTASGSTIWATPFLPITGKSSLKIKGWRNTDSNITPVAFYNKDFVFLGSYTGPKSDDNVYTFSVEDIPLGSKYIRCTKNTLGGYIMGVDMSALCEYIKVRSDDVLGDLFVYDGYIHKSLGSLNQDWSIAGKSTGFLPLDKKKHLVICGYNGVTNNVSICSFYDKNKKFISSYVSGEANSGVRIVDISPEEMPDNAYFFRSTTTEASLDISFIKGVSLLASVDTLMDVLDTISKGAEGNFFSLLGYVHKYNGNIIYSGPTTSWRCTPFILIDKQSDLTVRAYYGVSASPNAGFCVFYDENKEFISAFENPDISQDSYRTEVIPKENIPENAVYIRCTSNTTHIGEDIVSPVSVAQVVTHINNLVGKSDVNNSFGESEDTPISQKFLTLEMARVYGNFFTVIGRGQRYTDGAVLINPQYILTPMIPLNKNSDLIVTGYRGEGNLALVCFFDKDQKFISSVFSEIPSGFNQDYRMDKKDFPENAVYFRGQTRNDVLEKSYIKNGTLKYILDSMDSTRVIIDVNRINPDASFSTKEEARLAVPPMYRHRGVVLKYFLSNDTSDSITESFLSNDTSDSSWSSDILWETYTTTTTIDTAYVYAIVDKDSNVLFAIDENGVCHFKAEKTYFEETEWDYAYCIVDLEGKILFAIDEYGNIVQKNGVVTGASSIMINNLKTQPEILDVREIKNYGRQNAEYLINLNFIGRISVKGKFRNGVNDEDKLVPFVTFENGGIVANTLSVKHAVPTQGQDANTGIVLGNVPFPKLQSGFSCASSSIIYDRLVKAGSTHKGQRNNLCGNKIMMFWFKGLDVINKAYSMSKFEKPEDYFIPGEPFGPNYSSNKPHVVTPINGVATIEQLTPRRLYFITGKIKQLVINDIRRTTDGIDYAWSGNNVNTYLVVNWDSTVESPAITFGSSGITSTGDAPKANGYSTLQINGDVCTIKNTTTRAFNNYLPYEQLLERSKLFEEYKDLYIDVSNDTFIVGRDSTGVIWSTSLKTENGSWKTLNDFYKELVPPTVEDSSPREAFPHATIPELSDFYITFFDMSFKKDCSSILQSGKIYLTGEYPQILTLNPTGSANSPYNMELEQHYDCYPYFLYDKVDEQEHVFDFIIQNQTIKVYINGEKLVDIPRTSDLRLGNALSDLLLYDLEVTKGYYGDAEIMSDDFYLVSSRTPICLGMICHQIYDTYEGSNHNFTNSGAGITKIMDIAKELREKGYITLSMQEVVDWKTGRRPIPKKSAFLVCDDWQIPRVWLGQPTGTQTPHIGVDFRIRQSYLRYGLKLNFAQVGDQMEGVTHNIVANIRMAGCGVGNHTRWHNEPMWQKPAATMFLELQEMRFLMSEYGFNEDVFIFNKAGSRFTPQQDLLDYFGYAVGVGLGGASDKYTRSITSQFSLNRTNIGESAQIDAL